MACLETPWVPVFEVSWNLKQSSTAPSSSSFSNIVKRIKDTLSEPCSHRSLVRHTRVSSNEDVCALVISLADRETRFTQVQGPRRGKTLTPACLVLYRVMLQGDLATRVAA